MKFTIFNTIALSVLIGLFSSQSYAKEQGTFSQCQNINNEIEYYTNLRRSGGSPRTMENWKQKRDYYKDKFSEQSCRKWRSKLN